MEPSILRVRGCYILIPLFFFVLILSLHSILPERPEQELVFSFPFLNFFLNTVFVFLSSFTVAYLAGRTYVRTGNLSLLLLGAGALTVGLGNAISSWLAEPGGENLAVTVHNCGVLLAGALHFAGTVVATSEVRIGKRFRRRAYLLLAYAGVLSFVLLLSLFSQRALPDFFIQGIGFTPPRQMVLGSAVLLFSVSGFNFFGIYQRTGKGFPYWYSLALLLFATGLLGVFFQRTVADAIGWTGRSAQYLSGVFLFLSVLQAYKAASLRQALVDEVLSEIFSRSRELYAALVETTSDAVIVIDGKESVLLWNSAAQEMFGYTMDEVSGKLLFNFIISPHQTDSLASIIRGRSEMPFAEAKKQVEFEAKRRNGEVFPAEASISNPKISGQPLCTLIIRDVTERRQAEARLAQQAFMLANVSDGVIGFDMDYRIMFWGKSAERMYGYTAAEALGKAGFDILRPEYVNKTREEVRCRLAEDGYLEAEFVEYTRDGRALNVDTRTQILRNDQGESIGMVAVNRDITERKQAEDALRKALAKAEEGRRIFEAMMEHIPMGITIADAPDVRIRTVSRYGRELTGKPRPQIEGIPVDQHAERWQIFDADGKTFAKNEALPLTRATQKGELVEQEEWIIGRPDGTRIPILCTAAPIRDSQGNITGGVIGWQDIAERKRAEERMVRQNALLKGIAQVFKEALSCQTEEELGAVCLSVAEEITQSRFGFIGEIDAEGLQDIAISNPGWSACRMIESSPHRRPLGNFKVHGVYGRVLKDGKSLFTNDLKCHPDSIGLPPGHPPVTAFLGVPLIHKGKTIGIVALGNREGGYSQNELELLESLAPAIVEAFLRKRAEDALRQLNETLEMRVAERTKLAEDRAKQLARLTSTLALTEERERRRLAEILHDHLQQLLVGVRLNLDTLSDHVAGDRKPILDTACKLIADSIQTSRSITAELSPPILYQNGLVSGLKWLSRWVQEKYKFSVELQMEEIIVPKEDMTIVLFQAVRELIFNAVKHSGVDSARVDLSKDGPDRLRIVVSDDGKGFDTNRIWEHSEQQGGFGLFAIRERTEFLGVRFEIESAPGKGACFTLIAPVEKAESAKKPAALSEVVPSKLSDKKSRKIRILLVDDHAVVRQGLAMILDTQEDMEVVGQAADGEEAVKLAKDLIPDVILMDISLPEINGIEATRLIHSELPGIRIICLSMFEDHEMATSALQSGATDYLSKSGDTDVLLSAIRGEAEGALCGRV
jgi:PAS domain S-box-containing protein